MERSKIIAFWRIINNRILGLIKFYSDLKFTGYIHNPNFTFSKSALSIHTRVLFLCNNTVFILKFTYNLRKHLGRFLLSNQDSKHLRFKESTFNSKKNGFWVLNTNKYIESGRHSMNKIGLFTKKTQLYGSLL